MSSDKRSGITDDTEYIVRLLVRAITISLETVKIAGNLPPLRTKQA